MHTTQLTAVWEDCLTVLGDLIDEESLNTWFSPIKPIQFDGKTLELQVSSQFVCDFIEANFISQLAEALHKVIGPDARLRYKALVDSTEPKHGKGSVSLSSSSPALSMPQVVPDRSTAKTEQKKVAPQPFDSQLNPKLSFDCFYEGHCNRVALTVAKTISAQPGMAPMNPFFVYGASGVGKTHLSQAIGLAVREQHPHLRVLYVSAHLFEIQFTSAARSGKYNEFINFYQQIDLLIIDDTQHFIGKVKTQQAFFQVFNHLYMLGKQIVLTSDKPPVELSGMEERVVSRISGSLTVKLDRPDLELRRTILYHRIEQNGVELGEEVVDYIATNVTSNVRELDGTLISLITNSVIDGHVIDLPFTKKIVKRAVKVQKTEVTIELIRDMVAKEMQVSVADMLGKGRKREVALARQVVMYLSKKYTQQSLNAIGEMLGGRNHTTVLHGSRQVKNLLENDDELLAIVDTIEARLK